MQIIYYIYMSRGDACPSAGYIFGDEAPARSDARDCFEIIQIQVSYHIIISLDNSQLANGRMGKMQTTMPTLGTWDLRDGTVHIRPHVSEVISTPT